MRIKKNLTAIPSTALALAVSGRGEFANVSNIQRSAVSGPALVHSGAVVSVPIFSGWVGWLLRSRI